MGTASPISSIIVMGLVFIIGKIVGYFNNEKEDEDKDGDSKVNSIFEQFENHGMIDKDTELTLVHARTLVPARRRLQTTI